MKALNIIKLATIFVLFAAVVAFDYLTGYEVTSYPVYLLPIMLAFFYFGRWGGYVASVVATAMWAITDIMNGHVLSNELFRYWNAASRCGIYMLFVYGLSVYAKTVAVHRKRVEALQRLIPLCHGCGKIYGADGEWKTPEDLFAMAGGENPECPECSLAMGEHTGS